MRSAIAGPSRAVIAGPSRRTITGPCGWAIAAAAVLVAGGLSACSGGSGTPAVTGSGAGSQGATAAPAGDATPRDASRAAAAAQASASRAAALAAVHPRACPRPTAGYLTATPATFPRTVALTFDDGPSQWTPQFVALLARYRVHGTFFMVGSRAVERAAIVAQVVEAGDLVGNHTWDHPLHPKTLHQLPAPVVTAEIGRAQAALTRLSGSAPCFFRGPGEDHRTAYVQGIAHDFGLTVTDVTRSAVDAGDPRNATADPAWTALIVSRLTDAGDHPIVLMHDGHADNKVNQLAALARIITWYRARGYVFTDPMGRPFA